MPIEDRGKDRLFCYVNWKESHCLFDWYRQLTTFHVTPMPFKMHVVLRQFNALHIIDVQVLN